MPSNREMCFATLRPDGRFNIGYHYDDERFVASGGGVWTATQLRERGGRLLGTPRLGKSVEVVFEHEESEELGAPVRRAAN